jgi:hypothetical protein
LILGEHGTGKSKLINELVKKKIEKEFDQPKEYRYTIIDCISSFGRDLISQDGQDLSKCLDLDKYDLVVFDHLDHLSLEKQVELFNILSTEPGGISVITNKKLPQIIGVMSSPLVHLYDNPRWYNPLLDRFAQQVLILEPLQRFSKDDLFESLKDVWDYMCFKEEFPDNKAMIIRDWLYSIKSILKGNYRDLDVIAINLWRGAKNNLEVEDILMNVRNILESLRSNPNHAFRLNVEAEIMIKDFRKELIQWAEQVYPDTPTMLNVLKISEKTAYNWKNLK